MMTAAAARERNWFLLYAYSRWLADTHTEKWSKSIRKIELVGGIAHDDISQELESQFFLHF
jgi:hypothetical protein